MGGGRRNRWERRDFFFVREEGGFVVVVVGWLVVAGMKGIGDTVSMKKASPLQYIILIIIGIYEGWVLFYLCYLIGKQETENDIYRRYDII